MKQAPLKRHSELHAKSIRQLRPGEEVPAGEPRRYASARGYIRLRWKIGTRRYVETYEHRVVDGHVTTAEQVHHRNRNRADNRPENLEHLIADEHQAEHKHEARERRERVAELYADGLSVPQIAHLLGVHDSCVTRHLQAKQVSTRKRRAAYRPEFDLAEVAQAYAEGRSIKSLARQYRMDAGEMRKLIAGTGTPIRRPGRPYASPAGLENKARQIVYARSAHQCEVRLPGVCLGRATNWHHRINRSQGGPWLASNGLHVCGSGVHGCHGLLTNPNGRGAEFGAHGWTVTPHYERSPNAARRLIPAAKFPVYLWRPDAFGPEWAFLNDDGSTTPIDYFELDAVLAEYGMGRAA